MSSQKLPKMLLDSMHEYYERVPKLIRGTLLPLWLPNFSICPPIVYDSPLNRISGTQISVPPSTRLLISLCLLVPLLICY